MKYYFRPPPLGRRGWGGEKSSQALKDVFDIIKHLVVPKSNYSDTKSIQILFSDFVTLLNTLKHMAIAVYLNS